MLLNIMFFSIGLCSLDSLHARLDVSRIPQDKNTVSTIILGGGVSGLSTAVCLAQEGISTLVLEGNKPGGSLVFAQNVRNWPGKHNVAGVDIIDEIREHALANKVPLLPEEAVDVDFSAWPYRITSKNLEDGTTHERYALTCVIAMGSEPNMLGVPGESGPDGYFGKGVNTCVWCDGPLYQDAERVAVIGGGQGALFEARHMSKIAREVVVIVPTDKFTVKNQQDLDRLLSRPNVKVFYNTNVQEIRGDGQSVTHIMIKNNKTNQISEMKLDGLFLAVGSRPKTSLFKNKIELSSRGAIILKKYQETSLEGVFAVGDICEAMFAQAIASAAQGCITALQIKTLLEESGVRPAAKKRWGYDASWTWDAQDCVQAAHARTQPFLPKEVNQLRDFDELVLASKRLVVVDFYSPTCPACKFMMPTFEELAKNYGSDIDFVKVNITKPGMSALVGKVKGAPIRTIPTFVFVRNGKEIGRASDLRSKDHLKQEFAKYRR